MSISHILIIHPEGNFANNPGLSGIIEILCENGYKVTVIAPKRHYYQGIICPKMHLCLVSRNFSQEPLHGNFLFNDLIFSSFESIEQYVVDNFNQFDLIIAIDRGILDAAKIAGILNIPYGLISYEIFFVEEAGQQYKEPEKNACQGLAFAICQDQLRSQKLSEENSIPMQRIIQIPLCGRGTRQTTKTYHIHDRFGLSHTTKILLYMGSLWPWSMIDYILKDAHTLPNDWVLIIHNRYGKNRIVEQLQIKHADLNNVFFTDTAYSTHSDLGVLLGDVDAGIALYHPMKGNLWAGNNIKYIGLSSGKTSTCLQHGIPVIINDTGEMAQLVKQYELGHVIDTSIPLNKNHIPFDKFGGLQKNCYNFIEKYFDLNKTIEPFLSKLKELSALHTKQTIQEHFQKASASLNSGKLTNAIISYENIVALNPYSFQSHYALGELYRITGNQSKAINHYNECLKTNPVDRNVITRICEILRKTDLSTLATHFIDNYLSIFPDDSDFREKFKHTLG